jgi:nitrogen-specific signal transduction histidine kinase
MEENLPLVNVDREKIGQVIKNLIDNAIRYSEGGDIVCRAFVCLFHSIRPLVPTQSVHLFRPIPSSRSNVNRPVSRSEATL